MAPCWWFPCKPKHVGAVFLILKCFNNSILFNVVCISWKLKCWILLVHGVTMKFTAILYWNWHWYFPFSFNSFCIRILVRALAFDLWTSGNNQIKRKKIQRKMYVSNSFPNLILFWNTEVCGRLSVDQFFHRRSIQKHRLKKVESKKLPVGRRVELSRKGQLLGSKH